eukprot:1463134-Heterocapsa_arctica.AAC.1
MLTAGGSPSPAPTRRRAGAWVRKQDESASEGEGARTASRQRRPTARLAKNDAPARRTSSSSSSRASASAWYTGSPRMPRAGGDAAVHSGTREQHGSGWRPQLRARGQCDAAEIPIMDEDDDEEDDASE